MPLIVLGSAKGSPGVTTTALACAFSASARSDAQYGMHRVSSE